MPGIEKEFQLVAPSSGNVSPEFTSGFFFLFFFCRFQRVSPVSRAHLEQFDFLLCASKPGCELSKAASKAVVKTRRGESKARKLRSSLAERDGGGAEALLARVV